MTEPAPAPHTPGAPNVVDFTNVTKRFGSLTVIKDVTFSVPDVPDKGEFISRPRLIALAPGTTAA